MAQGAPTPKVTKPGGKRLTIALSVVVYILASAPAWWQAVRVVREPLPDGELQALASSSLASHSFQLPVHIQLYVICAAGKAVCLGPQQETDLAQGLRREVLRAIGAEDDQHVRLDASVAQELSDGTCPSPDPTHCLGVSRLFHASASASQQSQHALDAALQEALQSKQRATKPAHYHLFLWPAAAAAAAAAGSAGGEGSGGHHPGDAVVGVHRHAWLAYAPQEGPSSVLDQAAKIASTAFAARLGAAATRSAPQLPLSPRSEALLAFSLCNADPRLGSYRWRFDALRRHYLQPMAQALAPVASLNIQGQVLYYTPARTHGKWSEAHRAWLVAPQQLPFFIDSNWNLDSGRMATAPAQGTEETHADVGASGTCLNSTLDGGTAEQGAPSTTHLPPHVLSFVLYVPPPEHRPLLIDSSHAASGSESSSKGLPHGKGENELSFSFYIPSWGGLMILPDASSSSSSSSGSSSGKGSDDEAAGSGTGEGSAERAQVQDQQQTQREDVYQQQEVGDAELRTFAAVVAEQLHALMGLDLHLRLQQGEAAAAVAPNNSNSGGAQTQAQAIARGGVRVLPALESGFRAWEVDALSRQRCTEAAAEAAHTLASLHGLLARQPTLSVTHEVQGHVVAALRALRAAQRAREMGAYGAATRAAIDAQAHAEAAFSSPALMTQLNVPDSHYIGVYMPFFLPACVPLLGGVAKELGRYLRRVREHRAAAAAGRM